jgi:hypothetical protein
MAPSPVRELQKYEIRFSFTGVLQAGLALLQPFKYANSLTAQRHDMRLIILRFRAWLRPNSVPQVHFGPFPLTQLALSGGRQ